jgi:anti-sigma B factor antagonist
VTSPDEPATDITVDTRDGVAVLHIAGEIDMSNSDALRLRCVELLDGDAKAVVVDFSEVTFFASSGIAALGHIRQHNAEGPNRPVHVAAGRAVRRSLEMTAMDRLLPLHDTVEVAIKAALDDLS